MTLLWWIVVGLIAGWATGKIMRGSGYGLLMDTVIGILGALIGGWIMRMLGFRGHGGFIYTVLVAIGGAIVLTWVIHAIRDAGHGGRRRMITRDDQRRSDLNKAA
ncbi:MAG TPA: GlsB/YeaQ/YmgE family stress response membrane protein [Candidatus Angelobacter sp.]|nr:GlsB/YeaQ/YmgE family stress response membrane protein [Candidatus Angelobacter sp.]